MHKSFENAETAPSPQEAQCLRDKAARCRRLANGIDDRRTAEALTTLANEYERAAFGLAAIPDRT